MSPCQRWSWVTSLSRRLPATPSGRSPRGMFTEINRRPLQHVPSRVDNQPQAPAVGEEGQPVPAFVRIDTALASRCKRTVTDALRDQGWIDIECLRDGRGIDLDCVGFKPNHVFHRSRRTECAARRLPDRRIVFSTLRPPIVGLSWMLRDTFGQSRWSVRRQRCIVHTSFRREYLQRLTTEKYGVDLCDTDPDWISMSRSSRQLRVCPACRLPMQLTGTDGAIVQPLTTANLS